MTGPRNESFDRRIDQSHSARSSSHGKAHLQPATRSALTLWSILNFAALAVLFRKFAGGPAPTLYTTQTCILAVCIAALGLSAWTMFRSTRRNKSPLRLELLAGGLIVNPLIALAWASTSAGSPFVLGLIGILAVLSMTIVLLDSGTTARLTERQTSSLPTPHLLTVATAPAAEQTSLKVDACVEVVHAAAELNEIDDELVDEAQADLLTASSAATQWASRTFDASGNETLEGRMQAIFVARQKQAFVHVAFCPPFAGTPQFDCELADSDRFRFKIAAVYPYGARIEVKRTGDISSPASVAVDFSAIAGNASSGAAA